MSILSIFVDESGDFDLKSTHSPYYIFTLVFHDQSININEDILKLDKHIAEKKFEKHAIHSAPLIRREKPYAKYKIEERRVLFNRLYYFIRKLDVKYISFRFKKKEFTNKEKLLTRMARELSLFLQNKDYFNKFNKIKIYYDNGQSEIANILNISFNTLFSNVDIVKVEPINYILFQVADFICTIKLIELKKVNSNLSKSETLFFKNTKELKTIIKSIKEKEF